MKRLFFPNENWVYFKVCCSIKESDDFLINCIMPLAKKLKEKKIISKWFFVRYNEQELGYHLRIRFYCILKDNSKVYKKFFEYSSKFIEESFIWKIQIDTYSREIERYSSSAIELAESFFYNDSENVINLITHFKVNEKIDRWKYAFYLLNYYLTCLDFNILKKIEIMEELSNNFNRQMIVNKTTKIQMDQFYRKHKDDITNILLNNSDSIYILLQRNTIEDTLILKEIYNTIKMNKEVDIISMLSSLIHMCFNRLFRSEQKKNELIVYNLALKAYKTILYME